MENPVNSTETIALSMGDALIVNDVQNDFLPGGRLGVPDGDKVIPVLNAYIDRFVGRQLTVIATRDWHPPNHGSFLQQGGPWPVHCIAGTNGADFADGLRLPTTVHVIGKGMEAENEGYSAFSNPDFGILLDRLGITRLFVGGLTTDYCVFNTICDALKYGYQAVLLADAVRAVNVHARDGERAIDAMIRQGAIPVTLDRIQ